MKWGHRARGEGKTGGGVLFYQAPHASWPPECRSRKGWTGRTVAPGPAPHANRRASQGCWGLGPCLQQPLQGAPPVACGLGHSRPQGWGWGPA